jgi:sec-independent protein translocase protein TatB
MFDIGFWELSLIAVVALLVFGPEKLPGAARTAGLWIGRARRLVATVKQDIDRELHLQEAQEAIKQSEQQGLHQFIEETKTSLSELQQPLLPPSGDKPDLPSNSGASAAPTTNTSHQAKHH